MDVHDPLDAGTGFLHEGLLDGAEPLDFDLRLTLGSVVAALGPGAAARGVELAVKVEPEVPALLRGDPGRLRQLLLHLAGRTIRLAGPGPAVLAVALLEESGSGFVLYFSLRAGGMGAAEAAAGAREAEAVDGPLARRVAAALGGSVGTTGAPGAPFPVAWCTASLGRARRRGAPLCAPLPGAGLPLLVVDADGTRRERLVRGLEQEGAVVTAVTAVTARPAVVAAESSRFAAAAVAGELPGAAAVLDGAGPLPPLVLLATRPARGEAARARDAGFAGYLPVPVAARDLVEALGTVARAERGAPFVTRHALAEARKGRLRLLVVEGNASTRMITRGLLEHLGYRADACGTGDEAVEALRAARYDLVLMDLATRGVFGLEAARRIRSGGEGILDPGAAIVGLAGPGRIDLRGHALAVGMDEVLLKPLRQEQLEDAVARLATRAGPRVSRA